MGFIPLVTYVQEGDLEIFTSISRHPCELRSCELRSCKLSRRVVGVQLPWKLS